MIAPKLKTIGGDLNLAGDKNWSENSLPVLEYVGGNLIIANANFTKLPQKLKCIKGDVIISKKDPHSLLISIQKAKANGIIKGNLFSCV